MKFKMKKMMAICLMVVMVLSLSVNVLAAPGRFDTSPSGNPAPTVESFVPSNKDCVAQLAVVPFGDRNNLPDDLRTLLDKAYNDIANSDDLTKLNADLAKTAADKNIAGTDLGVSDLFDLHETGCESHHDDHHGFTITLDADTLSRFVGLLHMNKDGVWELVKDAEIVDGTLLKFSVDSLSPFAIVVNTRNASSDVAQTGDNSMIHICAITMAVSALAIIVIAVKSKKQSV